MAGVASTAGMASAWIQQEVSMWQEPRVEALFRQRHEPIKPRMVLLDLMLLR